MDNEHFSGTDTERYTVPMPKRTKHIYESGILCFIISFLIPFSIMIAAFAVYNVHPFGDRQMLVVDLWHQYYPFLVDFQDKLKNGESLFWSWAQGGQAALNL